MSAPVDVREARATVVWEKQGRCLWHTNCTAGPVHGRGIWREERQEEGRTLLKCVACGVYVFAKHGLTDGMWYSFPIVSPTTNDKPTHEGRDSPDESEYAIPGVSCRCIGGAP